MQAHLSAALARRLCMLFVEGGTLSTRYARRSVTDERAKVDRRPAREWPLCVGQGLLRTGGLAGGSQMLSQGGGAAQLTNAAGVTGAIQAHGTGMGGRKISGMKKRPHVSEPARRSSWW